MKYKDMNYEEKLVEMDRQITNKIAEIAGFKMKGWTELDLYYFEVNLELMRRKKTRLIRMNEDN